MLGSALAERGEFALAKASFDTSLRLAPNAFEILTFYAAGHLIWAKPNSVPRWPTGQFDLTRTFRPGPLRYSARLISRRVATTMRCKCLVA